MKQRHVCQVLSIVVLIAVAFPVAAAERTERTEALHREEVRLLDLLLEKAPHSFDRLVGLFERNGGSLDPWGGAAVTPTSDPTDPPAPDE